MKHFSLFAMLCVTALLMSCAQHVNRSAVIAENEQFSIVQTAVGDSYASLAREYLQDSRYASLIQRYNPHLNMAAVDYEADYEADYVAIPKVPVNPSGVFDNGVQKVPILCYHQFTKDKHSGNRMIVTESEFLAQMAYLHQHGYHVVSLAAFKAFIAGEQELSLNSVVITIDDGFKSFEEIALPILKRYQFPSTMFVYPDFVNVGKSLSWSDIQVLVNEPLVDIQSHSTTHSSLSRKPTGEQQNEYEQRLHSEIDIAQQAINARTGHQVTHFAYPYGNTSDTLVELLKQKDYDLAVTVQRGSNPAYAAPFLVNRTMIYGGDDIQTFIRALDTFDVMDLK